ncbi:LacI family DNA-binding transcriptional regulator [Paenibacillus yonginensis]|nr:LacI family DNA-binding transcriptional regulator [Paenibacillus yonginensis]
MARKISIQFLADQLGLSKYAVSRALSGKSGVSEATRARVLELARTTGYYKQQNKLPSRSETRSTASFVLICMKQNHQGNASYWQRVLSGLISGCSEQGWHHLILAPSETEIGRAASPEEAIAPHLDWAGCIGIIVMGDFSYPVLHTLENTGKPLVLVDHKDPMVKCDKVVHDNLEAGSTLVRHMLSLGMRHIGFIGDNGRTTSFMERQLGVRSGFEAYAEPGVRLSEFNLPYMEGGPGWLKEMWGRYEALPPEERPDSWICANDDMALGWMHRLQETGISLPGDLRIAGIDNIKAAAESSPPLTTVHLHKEELGQRAVEVLKRRIDRPGAPQETLSLSADLIMRLST